MALAPLAAGEWVVRSSIRFGEIWRAWATWEDVPIGHLAAAHQRRERRIVMYADAEARADELLRRFLTSEQRDELSRKGQFVQVGVSGTYYVIACTGACWFTEDGVTHLLCVGPHPENALPAADRVLATLLHLRNDEAHFRRTANIVGSYVGQRNFVG